ncbi:MAG: hypothetical protein HC888_13450 [Candidatus Competibacteraceae bacterium]|nr:hypothetical protein [Candidatus Competibacteraceae bacterium]
MAANALKHRQAAPGLEDAGQIIEIRERLRQPLERITNQTQAIAENRSAFANFQVKTNSGPRFADLNADFENLIRLFKRWIMRGQL